jgi:hypothetical protein
MGAKQPSRKSRRKYLRSRRMRRRHQRKFATNDGRYDELRKKIAEYTATLNPAVKTKSATKRTTRKRTIAGLNANQVEKAMKELEEEKREKEAAMANNGNVTLRRSGRSRKAVERFNLGGESSKPGNVRKEQLKEKLQIKRVAQSMKAVQNKREAEKEKMSSRGATRKSHASEQSKKAPTKASIAAAAEAVIAAPAMAALSVIPEKNSNNSLPKGVLNKTEGPANSNLPANLMEQFKKFGLGK